MAGRNRTFGRIHVVVFGIEQGAAYIIAAARRFHQIIIIVIKVGIEFVEVTAVPWAIVSSRRRRWAALWIASRTALPVASLRRTSLATFLIGWTQFAVTLGSGPSFAATIATFGSATATTTTSARTPRSGFVGFCATWRTFPSNAFGRQIPRRFVRRISFRVALNAIAFHRSALNPVPVTAARIRPSPFDSIALPWGAVAPWFIALAAPMFVARPAFVCFFAGLAFVGGERRGRRFRL